MTRSRGFGVAPTLSRRVDKRTRTQPGIIRAYLRYTGDAGNGQGGEGVEGELPQIRDKRIADAQGPHRSGSLVIIAVAFSR